ncbi:MAG: tyrosine-type recombinase/integrase [Acutalibacteraceae bacterium]
MEEKLILANPAKKCKIPKNMRKEMNILPEALIGPYLSAAKEHGILAPMYLELTTGLRRGELLALRWEDLDVQNRTLSVNKKRRAAEWKAGHQHTENTEFHPNGSSPRGYSETSCRRT